MKLQFSLFLTIILSLPACRKHKDPSPAIKEGAYLLSTVIIDGDTTRFEYNDKNQLIKWTSGAVTICDSFTYSATGQLVSCRYKYRNNTGFDVVTIACTYGNDTIIRRETTSSIRSQAAKKYTLTNDQLVKSESGSVFDGVTSFDHSNYYSYVYQDSNLIRGIGSFVTTNYQPIDSVSYYAQFRNPYATLGNHVWTIIRGLASFPADVVLGESKNLPFVESYATYGVTGNSLTFSGTRMYTTTVIHAAEEDGTLPLSILRVLAGGPELAIEFGYTKGY